MDAERLVEKLVSWIQDKVTDAGCKGVVIGISGGLDSSVASVLCHRAFPQNTLGLIMPCYSLQEDRELASYLDIPQEIINKPPSAGLWPGQTYESELGTQL